MKNFNISHQAFIYSCLLLLDGCPQGCMGHGVCQIVNDLWQCVCEDGFDGDGCQIELELVCNDGEDNDGGMFA